MTWTIQPRSSFGALAAITGGSGPNVVLVHGVGLRAEAWGGQLQALAQNGRVIAVDMPGHGESARLGDHPSLTDFSDAIAVILRACCGDRAFFWRDDRFGYGSEAS